MDLLDKIPNMLIMISISIMNDTLDRCKHYISEDIYKNLLERIEQNKQNNLREMFDEPNVSNVDIVSREVVNNKEIIKVNTTFKSCHYFSEYDTFNYVKGNNLSREEIKLTLTLIKDSESDNIISTCPHCAQI